MPSWYPSQEIRNNDSLASSLYPIMSVSERAHKVSKEANAELAKASSKAQRGVGRIELYSPKYYLACLAGGLLACVSCVVLKHFAKKKKKKKIC